MSEMELRRELKTIIAEVLEIDDYNDDDNFVTQLGVDSMLALEIAGAFERRYRIAFPECFTQMKTLNAVVEIVEGMMEPVKR